MKKEKMGMNLKKVMVHIAAAYMLVLLAGCGQAKLPAGFEEEEIRENAMKAIEHFNERDYESIIEMGSGELKNSITEEQFAEASDPYLDKRGEFQEIVKEVFAGNTDKKTGESYGGVVMIGEYEEGRIQFTIGFNEDMELVQFLIK